ncbi:MAG TPA: benzoyl-CoA reductase subunit A [Planctomycetes bacterium]|nr:benzoyl-CoA reductase subunit A [Planctomycetota bacterium]
MRCFVGIDLGSTTTKAVVIDEDERLLGRGITNSRSNYDVACAIARAEAFINARFALFEEALAEAGLEEDRRTSLAKNLLLSFRKRQHLVQHDALAQTMMGLLEDTRYDGLRSELSHVLSTIIEGMSADIPDLFAPGAKRKSDFFRDVASSSFMRRAEAVRSDEIGFDVLMGLFDKSIIQVENSELDISFESNIRPALEEVLETKSGELGAEASRIQEALDRVAAIDLECVNSVGTGYGRTKLPFRKEQIRSEILCHGLGAHWMFPDTRTVLDIGGQDTKAIQVDSQGIVTSFQMNDRCAAGCGRYLGYIADEMNLGLHELGPLAQKSKRQIKITSTCTVFAGAELRDRLTLGDKREDILAGLHRAMMLRAMSLLARSGGVDDEFTFTGGVAKNPASVDALRKLVRENYGERTLNISPDSIYTGAIGAALFANRDAARAEATPCGAEQ